MNTFKYDDEDPFTPLHFFPQLQRACDANEYYDRTSL